ncbi:hypothetical protein [Paenibacillus sp. OSY-SE]|uniref:hypothetical protein n=1 Tax=Paenibacillus sp. OSY-SE TaxID=1196323 RepID=UPI0002E95AED|nr:hypothetical protein [Paenibacillus sp. OSY-SE]
MPETKKGTAPAGICRGIPFCGAPSELFVTQRQRAQLPQRAQLLQWAQLLQRAQLTQLLQRAQLTQLLQRKQLLHEQNPTQKKQMPTHKRESPGPL